MDDLITILAVSSIQNSIFFPTMADNLNAFPTIPCSIFKIFSNDGRQFKCISSYFRPAYYKISSNHGRQFKCILSYAFLYLIRQMYFIFVILQHLCSTLCPGNFQIFPMCVNCPQIWLCICPWKVEKMCWNLSFKEEWSPCTCLSVSVWLHGLTTL